MRGLFWIAVLAGASYSLTSWGLADAGALKAAWKTSGVALLALWAATQARSAEGWLIAGALALGAADGDMLQSQNTHISIPFTMDRPAAPYLAFRPMLASARSISRNTP